MMKNRAFLRTVASLITVFFLMTNTVSAQTLSLAPYDASLARLTDLRIPENAGTLGERYQGDPGKPFLIFIQDAHTSREAQYRIRDLLTHFDKQYGIRSLFLEGATRRLQPSLYHFYKESDPSRKIGSFLLEQGELTGAELFLLEQEIAGRKDISADGIESIETYAENLRQFRAVSAGSSAVHGFMATVRQCLRARADKVFSRELRSFFGLYEDHLEGKITLQVFLDHLKARASEHLGLDLGNAKHQFEYPMFVRYAMIQALQSSVDPAAVAAEEAKLRAWLEGQKLDTAILDRVSGKGESRIGVRRELEALYRDTASKGFDFKSYPAWSASAAYRGFQEELEAGPLTEEMDRLTEVLFNAMAKSAEERSLLGTARNAILLEKLLTLTLTGQEWETITSKEGGLDLPGTAKAAGVDLAADPSLQNTFKSATEFYKTAREREDPFLRNITEHFQKGSGKAGVVITGGFHAESLKAKLRAAGFSYIEVSPRITALEKHDEKLYRSAMLETSQLQQFLRMVSLSDMTPAERALVNPDYRGPIVVSAMHTVPGTPREGPTALTELRALRSSRGSKTKVGETVPGIVGLPHPASNLDVSNRSEARDVLKGDEVDAVSQKISPREWIAKELLAPALATLKRVYPSEYKRFIEVISSESEVQNFWAGDMPRAAAVVRQTIQGTPFSFFAMDNRMQGTLEARENKDVEENKALVYLLLLKEAFYLGALTGGESTLMSDAIAEHASAAEQLKVFNAYPPELRAQIKRLIVKLEKQGIVTGISLKENDLSAKERPKPRRRWSTRKTRSGRSSFGAEAEWRTRFPR